MSGGNSQSIIYSGTFERSLDAKNRVTIPSDWLRGMEEPRFHSVVDPREQFLILLPPEEFAAVEQNMAAQDIPPAQRRTFLKKFYADSHTIHTDKQGRILLPEDHRNRAGLRENVVLTGGGRRFEIWNPERWNAFNAESAETYLKVADVIGL